MVKRLQTPSFNGIDRRFQPNGGFRIKASLKLSTAECRWDQKKPGAANAAPGAVVGNRPIMGRRFSRRLFHFQ